ncbi:uncharacterized protein LOC125758265 [Rhipicephalus sanguineus]|uniref:uncharacterized protein LOC125758265 n=1 Tax=Rhipicephalus sanguineus TaxID=34632 RepID=UPI0020C56FCC|nr:uncharacterized protein LOC125758265 [Rhipicephalus sanguineus]
MNDIWCSSELPEAWLTAVVVPVLKPAGSLEALGFLPEQQTGFRHHRCTADSIADVVSSMEDARSRGDVALVLLDVQSAFDGLPHVAIENALDAMGIEGCLRRFISGFLTGRTLRVRVGRSTSSPRSVMTGVPQGSVLSPLLFNLVLAALPAAIPVDSTCPAQCSIYADNVALWACGPRRHLPAIRRSLQQTLDGAASRHPSSRGIGLQVSPTKIGLMVHPRAAAREQKLILNGRPMAWSKEVTYLGLRIDHRLTWIPAVKAAVTKAARVQSMVSKLLLRGRGCPRKLALQLYHGTATAVIQYALPMVQLSWHRKEQLVKQHRSAIRAFLGLPRCSPVAATLAEAQTSPVFLLMLPLLHVDRLHCTSDGEALLRRIKDRPTSRMGSIWALYQELVPQHPTPVQAPPPHRRPPDINLRLGRLTKRRTPASQLQQATVEKIHEQLSGHLLLSTAAELAGVNLAADHLAANLPTQPVAIVTDSRPALQALLQPDRAGVTVILLLAKLQALKDCGVRLSMHWLPSHIRIASNEADAAAKDGHRIDTPVTTAVAASDFSRQRLLHLLKAAHPDQRVASGHPPPHTPALDGPRDTLKRSYRMQGLPHSTVDDLLFPSEYQSPALRGFLKFADEAGLETL